MRGMNSQCVDLIYLDPPFNSNRNYEAPIGSAAEGADFTDIWNLDKIDVADHKELKITDPKLYHIIDVAGQAAGEDMQGYLVFMAVRLVEMRRILKRSGSIYLHCDPTASHYLKMVMDAVFGRGQCRNEIIWGYYGPGSPKMRQFNRKHDTLFWYSNGPTWTFNGDAVRLPYKDPKQMPRKAFDTGGSFDTASIDKMRERGKIPETHWTDIAIAARGKERTGYPTQKPLKLLDRIIRASTNEGDLVFDPFCGCATSMVAAEQAGRKWAGCDLSPKAADLVKQRLEDAHGSLKIGVSTEALPMVKVNPLTEPPIRDDQGKLPPYKTHKKFLYGEQQGYCNGCGGHFKPPNLSVDHKIPVSRGGTDARDNLQLLCPGCNSKKGAKTMSEFRATLSDR